MARKIWQATLLLYLALFLYGELSLIGGIITFLLCAYFLLNGSRNINYTMKVIAGRLLLTYLAVLHVRYYIYDLQKVENRSMVPTLFPGDFVLVNKLSTGIAFPFRTDKTQVPKKLYFIHRYHRGDVITLRKPGSDKILIKKIVFLPGDKVTIDEPISGKTDGKIAVPAEIVQKGKIAEIAFCYGIKNGMIVPAGTVAVLGENLPASTDSRHWGFVPLENIVGKALIIIPTLFSKKENA